MRAFDDQISVLARDTALCFHAVSWNFIFFYFSKCNFDVNSSEFSFRVTGIVKNLTLPPLVNCPRDNQRSRPHRCGGSMVGWELWSGSDFELLWLIFS